MSPAPLLTASQVAEQLSVSTTAVYSLCDSGELPCFRIGVGSKRKRIRVSQAALDEYLQRCQVSVAPSAVKIAASTRQSRAKKVVGLEFIRSLGAKV